jgi:hypothetical protein
MIEENWRLYVHTLLTEVLYNGRAAFLHLEPIRRRVVTILRRKDKSAAV